MREELLSIEIVNERAMSRGLSAIRTTCVVQLITPPRFMLATRQLETQSEIESSTLQNPGPMYFLILVYVGVYHV